MGRRKGEKEREVGGKGDKGREGGGKGTGEGRWEDSLRHQQDGAHSPSRTIFS